jgi:hypothetical protein
MISWYLLILLLHGFTATAGRVLIPSAVRRCAFGYGYFTTTAFIGTLIDFSFGKWHNTIDFSVIKNNSPLI